MNNDELNRILKRLPVPERTGDFWEEFPRRISARLHWDQARAQAFPERRRFAPWYASALAAGLATLCLLLVVLSRKGSHDLANAEQLTASRIYFHQLEGLFPNQIRAIVFDRQGPHLVLADKPDVAASPPLYVRICGPGGCQSFVTFSGQQIRVNGTDCDVLVDHRGDVLLVGREWQWSSAAAAGGHSPYRIEAKPLEARS
jgi:hypothetical protein